jgi:hypothetical protein
VLVENICRGWVPDNPSLIISCISRCACFSLFACGGGGGVRVDEKGRDNEVPRVRNPEVLQISLNSKKEHTLNCLFLNPRQGSFCAQLHYPLLIDLFRLW